MAKVFEIGISDNIKGEMKNVNNIKIFAGKGLEGDRHFKADNDKRRQITLIEFENINYYNKISGTSFKPISFRRNIITQGIKLNDFLNKEFLIGKVKVKAHDLCRPCKYLQEKLKQNNIIKEFMHKGGLRCEILDDGEIAVGDLIKT